MEGFREIAHCHLHYTPQCSLNPFGPSPYAPAYFGLCRWRHPAHAAATYVRWRETLFEIGLQLNAGQTILSGNQVGNMLPGPLHIFSSSNLLSLPGHHNLRPPPSCGLWCHSIRPPSGWSHLPLILPKSTTTHSDSSSLSSSLDATSNTAGLICGDLPPDQAQPHAKALDHLPLSFFTEVPGIPADLPTTWDILNNPLAQGGFNIVRQQIEAQIHWHCSWILALSLSLPVLLFLLLWWPCVPNLGCLFSTQTRLARRLGEHSAYVHTCARGPCQHRHNAVTAEWCRILRAEDCHNQVEQDVLLLDSAFRKADLTALHTVGEHLALDVIVTGSLDPSKELRVPNALVNGVFFAPGSKNHKYEN